MCLKIEPVEAGFQPAQVFPEAINRGALHDLLTEAFAGARQCRAPTGGKIFFKNHLIAWLVPWSRRLYNHSPLQTKEFQLKLLVNLLFFIN